MNKKEKVSPTSKGKGAKEPPKKTAIKVVFSFHAPEAREVYLTGEFNYWNTNSLPMTKGKDGVWKTEIKLPPGCYGYKYFADSTWVENIPGAELTLNPFGTQNFVISVK
jgi:1,4-alpha-glucan branching enzyme